MANGGAQQGRQGQTYVARDGRVLRLGKAHVDRARQFMPFAALKGFDEVVAEGENEG